MKKAIKAILKYLIIYLTLFTTLDYNVTSGPEFNSCQIFGQKIYSNMVDNDQELQTLSYNIWGLPINIPGHHQKYRFGRIADTLLTRNFEIICLQEVFNPKVRSELLNKLSHSYFTASDYSCNSQIIGKIIQKDCHGGLMTLSKYPILEETFYGFKETKGFSFIEKIGSKGFLFSTIIWNGNLINIVNTHLYAGQSEYAAKMRLNQLKEMEKELNTIQNFRDYPTLLFGDLNISHPELIGHKTPTQYCEDYDYLTLNMEFEDRAYALKSDSYTINPDKNRFCSKGPKKKLDYILVHIPFTYDGILNLSHQTTEFREDSALSDHLGWRATIHYETPRELKQQLNANEIASNL